MTPGFLERVGLRHLTSDMRRLDRRNRTMSNEQETLAGRGRIDGSVRPLLDRLRCAAMNTVVPGYSKRALIAEAAIVVQTYEEMLFALGAMADAPCFCCGYNGPGYFQPAKHQCAARHRDGFGSEV